MPTDHFPSDSSSRKIIVVLKPTDIERCGYEDGAASFLYNDEAYIFPTSLKVEDQSPEALKNIIDSRLNQSNCILVQNPFDPNLYQEATEAPHAFSLEKYMLFSTFCMHLGAKEVCIEKVDMITQKGESSLSIEGGKSKIKVEGSIKQEDFKKFTESMNFQDTFEGLQLNIPAAERLLKRTGLFLDPNMRTLLEMRRDGGNRNSIKERVLNINLSTEAKRNISIIGKISVPGFIKMTTDYSKIVTEQREYKVKVVVKF